MSSFARHVRNLPWSAIALPGAVLLVLYWGDAHSRGLAAFLRDSTFPALQQLAAQVPNVFRVAFWLTWAWLLTGVLEVLVWEGYARHFQRGTIPRFFRHTANVLVFLAAAAGIIHVVFGEPLTALWATSGVLGLVLGFALKSLIADFFSGLALSFDPPFRIGDWVFVRLPVGEPIYGRVTEMHWRLTRIRSRGGSRTIAVPHSLLSEVSITTLYGFHGSHRFEVTMCVDQTVPVERAIRIMESAVVGLPMIRNEPRPEVLVHDTNEAGIIYRIRYWVAPDVSMSKSRHQVLKAILEGLSQAQLGFANTKRDVFYTPMNLDLWDPRRPQASFLLRCPVFSSLSQPEAEELAAKTNVLQVNAGQTVIRRGEPGDSIFMVAEGLLEVMIDAGVSGALKAAHLRPGEFFGEMSLLTGDPRSATVVAASPAVLYEVGRHDLQPLLVRNSRIAEDMCRVVAARRSENVSLIESRAASDATSAGGSWASQLLSRVRNFFGL
jgi:small-conductance mechanosensitive channel/CRP-like cAMP-binding protein